jgi:hypothetical protein
MFLRSKIRRKDDKDHRAWSVVENRRVHDGRVVQRQVLYLGEINDSQRAAWRSRSAAGQSKQIGDATLLAERSQAKIARQINKLQISLWPAVR